MRLRASWRFCLPAAAALAACGLVFLSAGCSRQRHRDPSKLTVAYLGLTCEAPIFVAQELGMFREEGLEVELVKTDWDGLREGLGTGRFDANHTLIMYLLKPIEQGLDVKITGGVHTGCLRLQVATNSGIKSVAELRGKRIGVPTHLGSPPYLFASRVLVAHGIDPAPDRGEVTWLAFPPEMLGMVAEDGRVDAVATSDPIGTILVGRGQVRTIADQATDPPYSEEYCCAVVVNGELARRHPEAAAKVTRAMLRAAKWVELNSTAAARMAVERGYIASTPEINAQALSKLKYIPGVARCKRSVEQAAEEMKTAGLIKPSTDPAALARRAWLDLDGVTDQWVAAVRVNGVEGGGRPALLPPREFAALFAERKLCCQCCCLTQ
jgi:NitT/TauT family transport system substrate-binding protein